MDRWAEPMARGTRPSGVLPRTGWWRAPGESDTHSAGAPLHCTILSTAHWFELPPSLPPSLHPYIPPPGGGGGP